MKTFQIVVLSIVPWLGVASAQEVGRGDSGRLSVRDSGKALTFQDGKRELAKYVYEDPRILRPFFANVRAPSGDKVTRNFPPVVGADDRDHDTMHPGIWLAFGDIDGTDFWRNKGTVRHDGFVDKPAVENGEIKFAQRKRYVAPDGRTVCSEVFRCDLRPFASGLLIELDSTFSSDHDFYFGDQEEMGLGIRVATSITEKRGGRISDSAGRAGADDVWSQSAAWVDYSGIAGDTEIGMTILCHPENFRASWMHARDYGLIAANAFGRAAMQHGPPDRTVVHAGETFRLRYGVFIHEGKHDPDQIYQIYLKHSDQH